MAHDPIATRYGAALYAAAKAEGRGDATLEQLSALRGLLHERPALRTLMRNPGVSASDKVQVLSHLWNGAKPDLVRAFVHMVITLGRAEYLQEIVEAYRAALDADQGRLRVMVRSARTVPAPVLQRLRAQLSRREGKTIELETEVDPALLGGLQIHLDHRVIDGSVQRQVGELRERLASVRVH